MLLPIRFKSLKIVKLFLEFIGTMLAHLFHLLVINLPDKCENFWFGNGESLDITSNVQGSYNPMTWKYPFL